MQNDILRRVTVDLLSIPPLTFRGIRRKLIKTTFADIDVNITPLHFEIMRLLSEEGTIHVAEIGRRLEIAKAQMTQLVDKLAALNIIKRKIDTADRRTFNITLTAHGKKVLREHENSVMSAVRDTMSCLTDEELAELSGSLRKVNEILSKLQ